MQIRTETIVGSFILIAVTIFFYMSFNIGVFRLDWAKYRPYTVYFDDVTGLQKKADVKIAGVKVGWIDSIELTPDEKKVKAHIMVLKQYELHRDAYAVVRQEGLLGSKYLEVIPGSPELPSLGSGESLTRPGKTAVNFDELMQEFKTIATNVKEVSASLRDAVGGAGTDQLRTMVTNFSTAADRIAAFSTVLDRTLTANEQNLNNILSDLKDFAHDLHNGWPHLQTSIEKISNAVDRDFGRVAHSIDSTAQALESASLQTRDSMRSIGAVADKINEGRGLLGKLVTEDETYHDLRYAVQGLKNYFAKVERLGVVFDAYSENMWGMAENYADHLNPEILQRDAKGYFGFRIHPAEDRFYILQAVASRKGWTERYTTYERFSVKSGVMEHMCTTPPPPVDLATEQVQMKIEYPSCRETTIQHRDGKLKFNIQMAKVFSDVAFRFGLFESTAGLGLDYDIPFKNNNFRWITSFEMYDFFGDDRIGDNRPHLKWINKLFMFTNFYMTFGADDFVSRHNANAFFGVGIRFADDDVKYLVSKVGSSVSS